MASYNVLFTVVGRIREEKILMQYLTDKKLREHSVEVFFFSCNNLLKV